MSDEPRPGPDFHGHEEVARILSESITTVRSLGYQIIASKDRGVLCVSTHADRRWDANPKSRRRLSPVGAVIMDRQPLATHDDTAACEALGVSAAWLMGFEAGVGGEPPHHSWEAHVAVRLIGEGYQLGREVRTLLMTEECPKHRIRHRRGTCPLCAAEVSADDHPTPYRADAGVIGPVPTRERR